MTNPPSGFSFDLYPGLDRELDEIFARNVDSGEATPEAVAASGLATAVNTGLQQSPNHLLPPEAADWAREQIGIAVMQWERYSELLGPQDMRLSIMNEQHDATLGRLYEAREDIISSTELNPEGLNIGETMKPVLVPWRAIKDNIARLPDWIKEMRHSQGVLDKEDYFDSDLLEAVQSGKLKYRNLGLGWTGNNDEWISAGTYLNKKLDHDGDWGIVLVQTSDDAGLKRIVEGTDSERSPDAMTNSGTDHFKVAGQNVDGLGIFEWLALTFQEDPRLLSSKDVSWLLANRLEVGDSPRVPVGDFGGVRVGSGLYGSGYSGVTARVRLAVI